MFPSSLYFRFNTLIAVFLLTGLYPLEYLKTKFQCLLFLGVILMGYQLGVLQINNALMNSRIRVPNLSATCATTGLPRATAVFSVLCSGLEGSNSSTGHYISYYLLVQVLSGDSQSHSVFRFLSVLWNKSGFGILLLSKIISNQAIGDLLLIFPTMPKSSVKFHSFHSKSGKWRIL